MRSTPFTRSDGPFAQAGRNQRAAAARTTVIVLVGLLSAAFFRIQILEHEIHFDQSTQNQVRELPLPAPRGFIYDRNGEVIAENLPAYSVSLLPPSEEALETGMRKLVPVLDLDPLVVDDLMRQYKVAPGRPILIDDDLDYRTLSLLEEQRNQIAGLLLQPKPRRIYPHGRATAHLTGYVAQISEDELSERETQGYAAGDILGKTGLERMYEARMRGEEGAEYYEVDALGRRVGPWSVKPFEAPRRGEDLHLSIDLNLQLRAAEIFPSDKQGAVVAIDPNTGEVLLLYSNPTFDANLFSGRLTREQWSRLVDDPARPLLNRTVQARYAPGSIFKLAIAAMGMTLGVVDPEAFEDVPCAGGYQFGRRWFGCHAEHGWAKLKDAIITSCDTYFYQVGLRLGLEELTRLGTAWDIAGKTGIDLPDEINGIFPTSAEWYDDQYGEGQWSSGVILNLSIGQGEIAVTPLKIAQFMAAVVNGGKILEPRILTTDAEPVVRGRLPLSREQFGVLRASLDGVINDWRGTAFQQVQNVERRYTIGGKSGTTEHSGDQPHAWFVAAGPMENPQIVVAILVEEGGSGSAQSPIAVDLIQMYLDGLNGLTAPESGSTAPIALSESTLVSE